MVRRMKSRPTKAKKISSAKASPKRKTRPKISKRIPKTLPVGEIYLPGEPIPPLPDEPAINQANAVTPEMEVLSRAGEIVTKIETLRNPTALQKSSSDLLWILRDAIALCVWIYVVSKLFIFDIDNAFLEAYWPSFTWLLHYKLVFFLAIVVICLLLVKRTTFLKNFSFFAFYPFINLFWRFPKLLLRTTSWVIPFALLNAAASFFKSIKYHTIMVSLWIVSLILAIAMSNSSVLTISIIMLLILTTVSYAVRFSHVFRTSPLLAVYRKFVPEINKWVRDNHTPTAELRAPRTSLTDEQLKKWMGNLETTLMYNRVNLFFARRLREYQNSGLSIVGGVASILAMFFGTALTFAAVNYALYKIDPSNFTVLSLPGFFDFFYYSFNTLFFNSVDKIKAVTPLSQTISMFEYVFSLILVAILIALVFSIQWQRTSDELTNVIAIFEDEGARMEEFIQQQFNMATIEDALAELEALKSSVLKIILFFTSRLR
jgi:hypothetical protein